MSLLIPLPLVLCLMGSVLPFNKPCLHCQKLTRFCPRLCWPRLKFARLSTAYLGLTRVGVHIKVSCNWTCFDPGRAPLWGLVTWIPTLHWHHSCSLVASILSSSGIHGLGLSLGEWADFPQEWKSTTKYFIQLLWNLLPIWQRIKNAISRKASIFPMKWTNHSLQLAFSLSIWFEASVKNALNFNGKSSKSPF